MNRVTTLCTLWKLSLKNGVIYTLTDHDDVILHAGETYHPQRAADAGVTENQTGFAIDTGEIRTRFNLPDLSAQAIRDGILDGAEISHFRHDWMSGETVLLSKGRVGEVRFSGQTIEVEWLGQTSVLDRSTGRVFSRQCDASFGDERCGLNVDDFADGTSCPRRFSVCRDQFANTANFRGFPYLLGDDVLQAGVRTSGRRDGSSRYP